MIVTPFPEPKPNNFIGAVGDFKISAEIDQTEVKVNEGITLTAGAGMAAIGGINLGQTVTVAVDEVLQDLDALGAVGRRVAPTESETLIAAGATTRQLVDAAGCATESRPCFHVAMARPPLLPFR